MHGASSDDPFLSSTKSRSAPSNSRVIIGTPFRTPRVRTHIGISLQGPLLTTQLYDDFHFKYPVHIPRLILERKEQFQSERAIGKPGEHSEGNLENKEVVSMSQAVKAQQKPSQNYTYTVSMRCQLCRACACKCPPFCISFVGGRAVIDQSKCTHCGACYDACKFNAIDREEIA